MTTDEQRGWRVGHRGRDQMFYEELHDGTWERIEIDGEMLMGRAHHVIYFAGPEAWAKYPAWAHGRRVEIIGRITSEFREPDYEYSGLGGDAGPGPATTESPPAPIAQPAKKRGPLGIADRSLLYAVLAFFAMAAAMGWLVTTGAARGRTTLPLKGGVARHAVARDDNPVMFWVSIATYAVIGAGTLTFAVIGARSLRRQ